MLRKRETAREDLWYLQEALSQLTSAHPRAGPRAQAGPSQARGRSQGLTPPAAGQTRRLPGARAAYAEPSPPPTGVPSRLRLLPRGIPWKVLGIAPGTSKDEAQRAFRALVTQYHPDKVAHLAPEFQELAERKTRELLEAWEQLEKALS